MKLKQVICIDTKRRVGKLDTPILGFTIGKNYLVSDIPGKYYKVEMKIGSVNRYIKIQKDRFIDHPLNTTS